MDGMFLPETAPDTISSLLKAQREAFLEEGFVSVDVRRDRLRRSLACLLDNKDELVKLVSEDFGGRSATTTLFADIVAGVSAHKDAIKHVERWMKPEKRPLQFPLGLLGARGRVVPQPKGVVGLITPWNFPLNMIFNPLAQMLAAGNRVMIKPSEFIPRTAVFLQETFAKHFDPSEIAVVTGAVETSQAFADQPWDHLMFTGAPAVGKHIMAAASKHLTPVTLELGGKSPVILGESADLQEAVDRIATFKLMNAGQICLAPDYVNVQADKRDAFAEKYEATVQKMYPTMLSNEQYTSIISARHRERLEGYLEDARQKGGDVRVINPANEDFSGQNKGNKMPAALILGATDDMKVMQEEIFGPVLPVRTYENAADVVDYVNARPRPLALYYFGQDKQEENMVVSRTTSGGVTVNDVLWHGAQETMPFGGSGNSGMGQYHGYDGFLEFSHRRSILKHPKINIGKMIGVMPPYTGKIQSMIKRQLK